MVLLEKRTTTSDLKVQKFYGIFSLVLYPEQALLRPTPV